MNNKFFGEYIKKLRENRGLSLREVEKKVGVSYAYISQVEKGERNIPSLKILEKLAEAYGVSISSLNKVAGESFEEKEIEVDKIENPNLKFLCRGYDGLSQENKTQLINYLHFLKNQENKK
ncbi:MAG: helix-turn-helix transcriptional regulator [bacterium]